MWFPNGTIMPSTTTLTNVPTTVELSSNPFIIDDTPAKNPPSICYVRNDGTVPFNITTYINNIVVSENGVYMNLKFYTRYFVGVDDGTALASRQYVIASTTPGVTVQPNNAVSIELDLLFYPNTDVAQSYTPGSLFNYSFDLTVTATQI